MLLTIVGLDKIMAVVSEINSNQFYVWHGLTYLR